MKNIKQLLDRTMLKPSSNHMMCTDSVIVNAIVRVVVRVNPMSNAAHLDRIAYLRALFFQGLLCRVFHW